MNNDRRTFLDGSIAPRKPLTEAKNTVGNDYPGQYGYQGGNQIGNY